MSKSTKPAITPTREENFPEWYQQVIKESKLAENSSTRGCMIILPLGQAIWENIQKKLDTEFKATGHENVYFPLLIPLELMQKEADHVEGFAKECAVVTHRRLVQNEKGELVPDGELSSPYIIRPTSEMVIGEAFARWIKSYRDLPVKINQWANVMRWEMRPRIFLRTAEFLWQEGHTVHATREEALEETLTMLKVYKDFLEEELAIAIIEGEKSESEKFPGADQTFSVEAMMQDGKALQAGTSHFLGQNFAKAQGIKFLDQTGKEQFGYTTSWGVSTRMIGGLIMSHSDDNGLVVPPRIAREQVVIVPIWKKEGEKEQVSEYVNSLKRELEDQEFGDRPVQVKIDWSDRRGGEKFWGHVKAGVPYIVEVGPRDIAKDSVFVTRRDLVGQKQGYGRADFVASLGRELEQYQNRLLEQSRQRFEANIQKVETRQQLEELYNKQGAVDPMVLMPLCDNEQTQEILTPLKLTIRCFPKRHSSESAGLCLLSGKEGARWALVGRSY